MGCLSMQTSGSLECCHNYANNNNELPARSHEELFTGWESGNLFGVALVHVALMYIPLTAIEHVIVAGTVYVQHVLF